MLVPVNQAESAASGQEDTRSVSSGTTLVSDNVPDSRPGPDEEDPSQSRLLSEIERGWLNREPVQLCDCAQCVAQMSRPDLPPSTPAEEHVSPPPAETNVPEPTVIVDSPPVSVRDNNPFRVTRESSSTTSGTNPFRSSGDLPASISNSNPFRAFGDSSSPSRFTTAPTSPLLHAQESSLPSLETVPDASLKSSVASSFPHSNDAVVGPPSGSDEQSDSQPDQSVRSSDFHLGDLPSRGQDFPNPGPPTPSYAADLDPFMALPFADTGSEADSGVDRDAGHNAVPVSLHLRSFRLLRPNLHSFLQNLPRGHHITVDVSSVYQRVGSASGRVTAVRVRRPVSDSDGTVPGMDFGIPAAVLDTLPLTQAELNNEDASAADSIQGTVSASRSFFFPLTDSVLLIARRSSHLARYNHKY